MNDLKFLILLSYTRAASFASEDPNPRELKWLPKSHKICAGEENKTS